MQESTSQKTVERKLIIPENKWRFYLAAIFFLIIVFATVGLYISTISQKSRILTLEQNIQKIEIEHAKLEAKKDVALALLLEKIGGVRESLDLVDVVDKFRRAATDASVQLQGFTLRDNTIQTTLVSTVRGENNTDTAYYIIKLVQDYIHTDSSSNGKNFLLKPIFSLSWRPDKRTTDISLEFISLPSAHSGTIESLSGVNSSSSTGNITQ